MPRGLLCLHEIRPVPDNGEHSEQYIDIVAVHGLGEDSIKAWTDPDTGINWLRDFLPKQVPTARVLTYGYDGSVQSFFGSKSSLAVQRIAEDLVQELCADRQLSGMRKRPIIFICHGLGGIVVKNSLVYASTRTSAKVNHLWDPYVSSFAILFFGTPHSRSEKLDWAAFDRPLASALSSVQRSVGNSQRGTGEGLQCLQSISAGFAPISKQFRMFFFWETEPTSSWNKSALVVDQSSAVPSDLDNIEKAGIHATHSNMVKFRSTESSGYRTVIEALTRYCAEAPRIISHRWDTAVSVIHQTRFDEAYELGGIGFDVRLGIPFRDHKINTTRETQLFFPPMPAAPDFVGRHDALGTLHNAFFPGGIASIDPMRKSFVVFGMGGSGKTQLCSNFAYECRNQYTAVLTIHAASLATIKESFCRIAEHGGLEATESAGKHFLLQLTSPWLLIIDNADDPSLDLQGVFPTSEAAHVLITTRNPDFRQHGYLGCFELKGLTEPEAIRLLLTRAEVPIPWDLSTTNAGCMIARTLGYLALALVHAGDCIRRKVCSLTDYLNLHATSRSSIQRRKPSTPDGGETEDLEDEMITKVYSSINISWRFLSQRQSTKSRDAVELVKIACFYHFERIPVDIFIRAILNRRRAIEKDTDNSITAQLCAAAMKRLEPPKVYPRFLKDEPQHLNKYRITWAISELQSLSLLSYDGRERTLSFHPLVYAWARDSLTVLERRVWASIAFNTIMESISLPSEGRTDYDGDFHRDILPHMEACLLEHENPFALVTGTLSDFQIRVARILRPTLLLVVRDQIINAAKCGYVLADRGQFEKAAEYLLIVKNTLVQTTGSDNDRTMSAMLGLAGVYWGLGKLEDAITLQRKVVETRSRIYGPEHEQTLQAMDQLGRSYWLHGQYQEALSLQTLTTERMKKTLGSKHLQTLAALDNLGVTLGAWHRYEESMQVHQHVLHARRLLLGETHLETLATMGNLAMALLDLGRLDEANQLMREVYQQRQQQLGKEHPWTLWALCYLAKIQIAMGSLQEAEKMLTWGIEAGVRSLGKDHLGVLMGRGELGRIYARQGRLSEAESLSVETVALVESSRGIAHPDCVYGLWKLAQLYELKGDFEKAIETCQLGLERAGMRITIHHPLGKKIQELLRKLQGALSAKSE